MAKRRRKKKKGRAWTEGRRPEACEGCGSSHHYFWKEFYHACDRYKSMHIASLVCTKLQHHATAGEPTRMGAPAER